MAKTGYAVVTLRCAYVGKQIIEKETVLSNLKMTGRDKVLGRATTGRIS